MKTILNKRNVYKQMVLSIGAAVLLSVFAGCGLFSNPDYAKFQVFCSVNSVGRASLSL
jgi:hypothetical protein